MDSAPGARRLEELAWVLARAVDSRAYYEPSHSDAVARLCAAMAGGLGFDARRTERLRLAARMHDVGKIAVPDRILLKPSRLTAFEFEWIKRHPGVGSDIVCAVGLQDEARWILYHHERPDGRGYPYGIVGDELPFESRMIAVADAFDVMTTARTYRNAISEDAAIDELECNTPRQFDERCVHVLREAVAPVPA